MSPQATPDDLVTSDDPLHVNNSLVSLARDKLTPLWAT
jgi:hypothetical protein